jgi:hypothetical protein
MSDILFCKGSGEFAADQLATCCPECEAELSLHQPDPQLPNQLLATCGKCKSWYLTDSQGEALTPLTGRTKKRGNRGLAW